MGYGQYGLLVIHCVHLCKSSVATLPGAWVILVIVYNLLSTAIVAKCPDIPNPLNGKIDFAEDNLAPFDLGTTATYICDLGYAVTEGSKMRVCVMDELGGEAGIWNGKAPTCDGQLSCTQYLVVDSEIVTWIHQWYLQLKL